MFTGLVEEAGTIRRITRLPRSIRLVVDSNICAKDLKVGDSLAVNGCCLTVVGVNPIAKRGKAVSFDLLHETWIRTNLQFARTGDRANLERPLRADSRLGGHFVTGHIDGIGTITKFEVAGADHLLEVAAPKDILKYVIFKGSIAVDGISLTVSAVRPKSFCVWIVPHTYDVTALGERKVGDKVNLEADLLGKYVSQFVGPISAKRS